MNAILLLSAALSVAAPKAITWTFDDVPHQSTPRVLQLLKCHHVQGHFFVAGGFMRSPKGDATLRQIAADGHLLGNHLWSHRKPRSLGFARSLRELRATDRRLRRVLGAHSAAIRRWYRPPFGQRFRRLERHLVRLGWRVHLWNVSAWQSTARDVWRRALRTERRRGTAVILFHWNTKQIAGVLQLAARAGRVAQCRKVNQ